MRIWLSHTLVLEVIATSSASPGHTSWAVLGIRRLDFGIAQIAGDVRALVAGLIITVSFVLLQVFEVKHTAATARHAPWCATGQAGPSRLPASSRSLACAVPPLAGWACVGW